MSVLWSIPQRITILRANQLAADSATALQTAYTDTGIGQTEMGDRAIEFPFEAINDALLEAGSQIVQAIGNDPHSPYRTYFAGVTASLATGANIPTTSSASKPVIGKIGDVLDASTSQKYTLVPYQVVQAYNVLKTNILKVNPYQYYTDNKRIYHTGTNVVADVVIWSNADQTALMITDPRGACPFPENLLSLLVDGALSRIFRGTFNIQQAPEYYRKWVDGMSALGMNIESTMARSQAE